VTVYYRDDLVRITDTTVEVGTHAIPLVELSYVWHQRGRPTLRTTSRRAARLGLIAVLTVPVVVGAVVVANLVAAEQGVAAKVAIAAVLVGVGLLLLLLLAPVIEFPMMALERSYDRGTDVREIWVRWQERDLMLLRTSDAARFGKIYRAIQRAIELQEG
jgi:hypothetical protein